MAAVAVSAAVRMWWQGHFDRLPGDVCDDGTAGLGTVDLTAGWVGCAAVAGLKEMLLRRCCCCCCTADDNAYILRD